MIEYGNGVGQVVGQAGGVQGGGPVDLGASAGQFMTGTARAIASLPPGFLVAGIAIVLLGLLFLRRAF